MQSNDAKPALLTRTEVAWLLGKIQVSKLYEYRIRSDIKKKLQVLQEIELPLLKEKGFVSESIVLSANPQNKNLSANPQFENSNNLAPLSKIKQPWPGFGPGTFALPRQLSYVDDADVDGSWLIITRTLAYYHHTIVYNLLMTFYHFTGCGNKVTDGTIVIIDYHYYLVANLINCKPSSKTTFLFGK